VLSPWTGRRLGRHPHAWVIPNGIDLPRNTGHRAGAAIPTFVFVGAMFYEPNVRCGAPLHGVDLSGHSPDASHARF
jgi:hypothetical protein